MIAAAQVLSWSGGATSASPSSRTEGESAVRQTYIQESINFTGAELAARLDSMQARLRAQRAPATPVPVSTSNRAAPPSPARSSASNFPATANPYASSATAPGVAASAVATGTSVTERPSSTQVASPDSGAVPSSYGSSYSPSTQQAAAAPAMQGLSASDKLKALQQVQQASRQALQQANGPTSPYYVNAPKTIDVRMYDQLVAAHNKLSKRLGEGNAHIEVLQEQVDRCNEDLMAAFELLKQVSTSYIPLRYGSTTSCTSVHFS